MSEPIACTLTATQYEDRAEAIAELTRASLISRDPLPGGIRLRFAASPGADQRLRAIILAESECCAFLQMNLREVPPYLELDVTGPTEAAPIIAQLFA